MKHLVLTRSGAPSESVTLHEDRDPAPGPRDVLVRMEAAAVNPSDLLLVGGRYFARPEPPAPVGGEGVGIVVGAGAQAENQALLGKRVIVLPTYTQRHLGGESRCSARQGRRGRAGRRPAAAGHAADQSGDGARDAQPVRRPQARRLGSDSRARTRPSDAL